MPTVLRSGAYRFFFFYSDDRLEPAHVHVRREGLEAKFWLQPVSLARNDGFRAHELAILLKLVRTYALHLRSAWNEFHDPDTR